MDTDVRYVDSERYTMDCGRVVLIRGLESSSGTRLHLSFVRKCNNRSIRNDILKGVGRLGACAYRHGSLSVATTHPVAFETLQAAVLEIVETALSTRPNLGGKYNATNKKPPCVRRFDLSSHHPAFS